MSQRTGYESVAIIMIYTDDDESVRGASEVPSGSSELVVDEHSGDQYQAALLHRGSTNDRQTDLATLPSEVDGTAIQVGARTPARPSNASLWLVAGGSALVLACLTIAGIYLVTKKPATVDKFVILTVPSGAEVRLDSKSYGNSPVKLENVPIGTYTLTITKDNFETDERVITISNADPPEAQLVEVKLRPLPSPFISGRTPEEQIKFHQEEAEQAFNENRLAIPYDISALYHVDRILNLDGSNTFAVEMRGRIRIAMHSSARAALSRGDVGQAQEIYNELVAHYEEDEEAKTAAAKLENQLVARRGEVRDLVNRAGDALNAGNLTEPANASAYYLSKQALAIDRQNPQAREIRNQVKQRLTAESETLLARGDSDAAIKSLEHIRQLFPEDRESTSRLRQLIAKKEEEKRKANNPEVRRWNGLEKYRKDDFRGAIPDLEFALTNDEGTPDVIFALARAHKELGNLDQAAAYFHMQPKQPGETYRSARAELGDIAYRRGDQATALAYYKEAISLGGSTLHSIDSLQYKIDRIERTQREKASQPIPLSIQVKHQHGAFRGSCKGTLQVSSTGVRFDGDHVFSANVVGLRVSVAKDKLTLFLNGKQEFKGLRVDLERFQQAVVSYQNITR